MNIKHTIKQIVLTLVLSVAGLSAYAQSNFGEVRGKVVRLDQDKNQFPVKDVNVLLYKDGAATERGATTDVQGNYFIKTVDPGDYMVIASHQQYGKDTFNITVVTGGISSADFYLTGGIQKLNTVKAAIRPNDKLTETTNSPTIGSKQFVQTGQRSGVGLAQFQAGVNSTTSGISFNGSRADGTAVFIDGVRVFNSSLAQATNGQTTILASGIPAQFGDFTGGAISITTKGGISNRKSGSVDVLSSSLFNAYHYNLIEAFYTAPLWTKKIKGVEGDDKPRERTIMGFLLAGNFNYQKEPNPSAIGYYVVKEDKLKQIEQNPLIVNKDGGFVHAANYLTLGNDFDHVDARPNARYYSSSIQGKLDYAPTKNIDITFFNNVNYTNSLAPGGNNPMNYSKNPLSTRTDLLSYIRFTQRLKDPEDSVKMKKTTLSNAYYTIRFDYQSTWAKTRDQDFGENLFNYGYIGQFKHYPTNFYQNIALGTNDESKRFINQNGDTVYLRNYVEQIGFRDTQIRFTPSDLNPLRATYTSNLYKSVAEQGGVITTDNQILQNQGLINGFNPSNLYSLWNTPGTQLAGYSKSQAERYTLYALGEAQLKGAAKEDREVAPHDLQFGFTYEQTVNRGYSVGANSLWQQMNLLMNSHIASLDTAHPIFNYNNAGVFNDTITYNRLVVADKQTSFDKNFRQKLINEGAKDVYGNPITQTTYVDINSYKPSDFSLNMFSADELLNNGSSLVSYYGYDYLGKKLRGKPSLDDFLNDPKKRSIGAFMPIYTAAWIQDQFKFKDLVFRVGLRFERYDANQVVLKDPYSLYPIKSAGEVNGALNKENGGSHPGNIGEDYAVYVNDVKNPTEILGYRKDNKWYNAKGAELTNPELLANDSRNASGKIAPYLVNPNNQQITTASFKDYAPKVNVLPRIYFQFPIQKTALFYASYDVLAQRPLATYSFLTIDDYFYMTQRANNILANPDLKSRLKTDYRIGFKQQIGRTTNFHINAFYTEIKNDINQFQYNQAYPVTYISYNNVDFSTIKGFSGEFEYVGKNNISIAANYTLQFADGTGSNPNAARALIASNQPNLRTLFPLGDLDIRHTLKAIFNYEFKGYDYAKRKNLYTGPIIGKTEILKNTNFNFSFIANSGLPYTATSQPVNVSSADRSPIVGSPYGSRQPWQITVNMNISKNIILKWEDKDGKNRGAYVQVYLFVTNLLNTKNIVSVYSYSGLPNDDGYVNSAKGQQFVASQLSAQSYADYYRLYVNSPGNYGAPRYARLGVKFQF